MPRIVSYTPAWLSRPSPGFRLFSSPIEKPLGGKTSGSEKNDRLSKHGRSVKEEYIGTTRTIARRGTEIFVVVGNTIRWSDLCMLKESWEDQQIGENTFRSSKNGSYKPRDNQEGEVHEDIYRVLKVPVNEQIRQLIPSPNGELLAILTSHTVHIAILPDPIHLEQPDTGTIRLRTYTVGSTTHVLSQSPVISALWHPLGVGGNCLVTVTAEAVVRLWELDRENRWSFDRPSLAFDLKKLIHGKSAGDNFSALDINENRGFSLDSIGMEVASACFGGTGAQTESGWCSMTLWVAMKEGDVCALCPLLPSKWQPPSTLIPALTTIVAAKTAFLEEEDTSTLEQQAQSDEQYQWLAEIDRQDIPLLRGDLENGYEAIIYDRPSNPGPIPKLQGPFHFLLDDDQSLELSDIHVIASKLDTEELMEGEDDDIELDDDHKQGLSSSVICLLTRGGKVLVFLDLDGVEAKWLPPKKSQSMYTSEGEDWPELVLLEALDTLKPKDVLDTEWPTFTPDIHSRHSFFTTHSKGVFFFSLDPWIPGLESELQNSSNAGVDFRLNILTNGAGTLRERILRTDQSNEGIPTQAATACVILQDSDLGYFLLTSSGSQPQAAILDNPNDTTFREISDSPVFDLDPAGKLFAFGPARSAYQPPESLWAQSALPNFLSTHVHLRHQAALTQEIRLSPATLDAMTRAHRVLAQETHELGIAAADLFRRCERLVEEFRDQLHRSNENAVRIEQLIEEDADDYGDERKRGAERLEERVQRARKRQEELVGRLEGLRSKVARVGERELSEKEEAWIKEVGKLAALVLTKDRLNGDRVVEEVDGYEEMEEKEGKGKELRQRYEEAHDLAATLLTQASQVAGKDTSSPDPRPQTQSQITQPSFQVPPDIRKVKVKQVMALLERETVLVDAAQARLEKLSLGVS